MRWLPCGALLAAAGCTQFPGGMSFQREDAQSQVSAARMHESRGQSDQARDLYKKALANDAGSLEAHHRLALINARQRRWGEAEQHFLSALKIKPQDSKVLADYGYMQYCQERLVEAERSTRQALERDPKNQRIINNLALIVGRQARYPESLALFRQAGSEAQSHANIAWIYAQNGETDLAAQSYSRAISLDANNRAASIAFAQLCEARQSDSDEWEQPEGIDRRTLPPANPRRQSTGKIAANRPAPGRDSSDTSVRPASLDDRSVTPTTDLSLDMPAASLPRKSPTNSQLNTAASFAPVAPPVAPPVAKKIKQTPPARVAPPAIVAPQVRVAPPIRVSPPVRVASPARVAPPVRVAANQPNIRSKQMAERAIRPAEPAPTLRAPELPNPLVPETSQVQETAESWADPISRKIAERPENVTVFQPEEFVPASLPKPSLKSTLPVAKDTVANDPVTDDKVEKQPPLVVKPAKKSLDLPIVTPKSQQPAKSLKVVEPLEFKKSDGPPPQRSSSAKVAASEPRTQKNAPLPWQIGRPADMTTESEPTPVAKVATPAKAVTVATATTKDDEPLPPLPGATPAPTGKTSAQPGPHKVAAKSSATSKKTEDSKKLVDSRKPAPAVSKTDKPAETKNASKPLIRRLDIKHLFSRSQKPESTQKPVAKTPEKPAVRRLEVKPVPAADPQVARKPALPPIRHVAARNPNVPFLSETEPEPLPFLTAEEPVDHSPRLPTPVRNQQKAEVRQKEVASAKPVVPAQTSGAPQPSVKVAPPALPGLPQAKKPTSITTQTPAPPPTILPGQTPAPQLAAVSAPAPAPASAPKLVAASKQTPVALPVPTTRNFVDLEFSVGDLAPVSEATEQDIAQLAEMLRKGTPVEREAAATALGELGALAAPAVPTLLEALVDSNEKIRRAANTALEKIEGSTNFSGLQHASGTVPAKGQ